MINKLFMVVSLLWIFDGACADITDFKRPCKDYSQECLKESLQAFIPVFVKGSTNLGLERLDPFYIDELNLTLAGGISVQFRDGVAKGLRSCIVDSLRFSGYTLETHMHCNLTIKGKYKSTGQLMVFPIDGEGISLIKCRNIGLHTLIKFGIKEKEDGQRYFYIKNVNVRHSYDGRVSYNMTNLFRSNPEISKALVDFMNENWLMIADEFGGPMVEVGIDSVMRNIRRLIDVVPVDEIRKL